MKIKPNDPKFAEKVLVRVCRQLKHVAPTTIEDWYCGAKFLSHVGEEKEGSDMLAAIDADNGGVCQFVQPFLEMFADVLSPTFFTQE